MKKRLSAVITAAILIISAASCGGSAPASTTDTSTTTAAETTVEVTEAETDNAAEAAPDFSNPDVVIELGDYANMETLCKSIQNFEMVGKVVKITGINSKNFSSCSIMESDGNDSKVGFTYKVEGFESLDDYPAEDTVITITAEVVAEGIVCHLAVLPENFVIAE